MTAIEEGIEGHILVVMAPSGSGKGTLVRRALEDFPSLRQTISCTSRPKRPDETDGVHYHFVSPDEFTTRADAGDFLEWAEYAGHKYGTLKSEIIPYLQKCMVTIVEIELQGVEQLLEIIPKDHLTLVYIEAGDWETLRARASARAPISSSELAARKQRFLVEAEAKPLADVIIDNRSDIELAYAAFRQVIEGAYHKCKL